MHFGYLEDASGEISRLSDKRLSRRLPPSINQFKLLKPELLAGMGFCKHHHC
jgi:hypothetical protein